MDRPTLIIFAEEEALAPEWVGWGPESLRGRGRMEDRLRATLKTANESGLPMRFVAPGWLAHAGRDFVPETDIIPLPDGFEDASHRTSSPPQAISAGVLASAQARGWLLLPASQPSLRADTLLRLSEAMHLHPVVYPVYQLQEGLPVGFSSEFFSELLRLDEFNGLSRLMSRYPAAPIEVDDPGVLTEMNMNTYSQPAVLHQTHVLQAEEKSSRLR